MNWFKKIIASSLILISSHAEAAGVFGSNFTNDIVNMGDRTFNDVPVKASAGNMIELYCEVSAATHQCTFRKNLDSGGYKVTAGKTLTVYALKVCNLASTGSSSVQLGSSTADTGLDGVTALSSPSYLAGGSGAFEFISGAAASITPCVYYAIFFQVAGGTYLAVTSATAASGASSRATVVAIAYEN